MSKKSVVFLALALVLLSGMAMAQEARLTDDRELFMGVPTASSIIRPNVMVLVDVTGSMTQSIYHPYFTRKKDYRYNDQGTFLAINNLTTYLYGSGTSRDSSYVPYNSSTNRSMTQEFRVCRNSETYITTYDVRAKVTSTANVTGQPNWRRWNLNSRTGTFVLNQIIDYTGVDNLPHQTRIRQVYSQTRLYVDKQYEATYVEPMLNTFFYVNPHAETRTSSVNLLPTGTDCAAGETAYDVKLYAKGNEYVGSEPENDYEYNYLCWLFFQATPEQIAEVNNWSNTGEFISGVPAGRCRISVAKEAVQQIITDNYDKFNLGLATFSSASSGASLKVRIKQQNINNPLTTFQTAINSMDAGGSTPLASAMADMWSYFKGTFRTNYNHNDGSQALDALDDRPIKYWCQSNYIILVTDGESYSDQSLTSGRFAGSLLSRNPDLPNSWGVADGHDITVNSSGVVTNNWYNTSFANYCPNFSCWNSNGSDWLDDIAYLMYHNDLFPNDIDQSGAPYAEMPTKQFVETFAIGFSIDNDMLYNTAEYGNTSKGSGAYRSANNYTELMSAIQNFIINISLRDFGFSSFTAPKKVSSALGEGSSFVGYFKPRSGEAIWEGHLQSFKLTDKWCPDSDLSGGPSGNECMTYYGSKLACENANSGLTCYRSIDLAATPDWDTATLPTNTRLLYTHNSANVSDPYALLNFTDSGNITTLRGLFGLPADATGTANAQVIVDKISATVTTGGITSIQMADVFHSDIAYVGPPISGKKYLKNLNPPECGLDPETPKNEDANCFENLAEDQANRQKVLYVGTNDGVIHQINATTGEATSGKELWGFIPDEVLPSLKTIAIDNEFAFTTDGRIQADDIYYRGSTNSWKTILAFGLKDGGKAFYAMDITTAPSQPQILWKFSEPTYSGKSWGKPNFGKIKYWNGNETIDLWVIVLAGGFAFNNENPDDLQGKAVFVLDASTGLPIWTLAFNGLGQADNGGTAHIETLLDSANINGLRYLTAKPEFNYCIPSSLIPIDRDSDGYLDTIYFGNVAGHMFKTSIADANPGNWKSYLLFKNDISASASARVSGVSGTQVTLTGVSGTFAENMNVFASGSTSSHAMGIVNGVNSPTSLTIAYTPSSGPSFQVSDTIIVPTFDPIYLSPAVFFDPCYNLWVAFGTGDRLRSRTNPDSGKFAAFRDGTTLVSSTETQKTDLTESDLVTLTWSGDTLTSTPINAADKWGWYFDFPQAANHEKMFDPEPLILPDQYMVPHIFFNTYQPSTIISGEDCNAPEEGNMKFYDLKMNYCGDGKMEGERESGRIAGGGMFQGSDFILYEGTGNVASIPPLQEIKPIKLIYTGGLLFYKEKKR